MLDTVPVMVNESHGQDEYIPVDLYDAINHLKKLLDPDLLQKMKVGTEDGMIRYHMGLGMWMRNNWGLWSGSELSEWFNAIGIHHPDDMSGIILDTLWRDLNGNNIRLQEQVDFYKEFWGQAEDSN